MPLDIVILFLLSGVCSVMCPTIKEPDKQQATAEVNSTQHLPSSSSSQSPSHKQQTQPTPLPLHSLSTQLQQLPLDNKHVHATHLPLPQLITPRPKSSTCSGKHIRNTIASFDQLRGCNIINGPLTIALVSNRERPYEPADFENVSFPELREITDYLILFRVQGLSTLSKLFPNLAVIRGKELVNEYAFVIYEMMHLQEINLPNLSDILNGNVRIESNPNLCFSNTINWDRICKGTKIRQHFIKGNSQSCNINCPSYCEPWPPDPEQIKSNLIGEYKSLGTESNRFCWNSSSCHQPCKDCYSSLVLTCPEDGVCCSDQCAGGCYVGNRSDQCISCRSVIQGKTCVSQCDAGLYEFDGSCISKEECIKIENEQAFMKPIDAPGKPGKCVSSCPSKSEENPINKHECRPCDKGKCRKVCVPSKPDITDISSVSEFEGCSVIDGNLDIAIKGGKNVTLSLKTAFQDLEEIQGFLKITGSTSLLTLGFLDNLRIINGSSLDRNQYSLIIINNQNLRELFSYNNTNAYAPKRLTINKGKIFVHMNPKLCLRQIEVLKNYANVADWDEADVSKHTNGDKESCNLDKLELRVKKIHPTFVMIEYENYALRMDDSRPLLSYIVNYSEAPAGVNLTMYDGRDGCSNDSWKTQEETAMVENEEKTREVILPVKPATRYALYVKTFTILSAKNSGALSEMIYFVTSPDTPGHPRQLTTNSFLTKDSVTITWLTPLKPNGYIEKYVVTITRVDEMFDRLHTDICTSTDDREIITKQITQEETKKSSMIVPTTPSVPPSDINTSKNCDPKLSTTNPELQADVVEFQDTIIDRIYQHQQDVSNNIRRKRAISFHNLAKESEGLIERNRSKTPNLPVEQEIKTTTQPSQTSRSSPNKFIDFPNESTALKFNVSSNENITTNQFQFTIKNLHHYTSYTVEVIACHKPINKSNVIHTSSTYRLCGLQAFSQFRTSAIEANDKIAVESIEFFPSNETHESIVRWKEPEHPNGKIFAYKLQLRKTTDPTFIYPFCINNTQYEQDGGFKLGSVASGTYLFKVQAITMFSLSGLGIWTESEYPFEIPDKDNKPPIWIGFIALAAFVILIVTAYVACYVQKQKIAANGLLYASVNPDYTQYVADEWEVDKKNLVIGESIGTGSFGQVFKGELVTEKGKTACAIKTVPTTATAKHRMDFLREASTMKQFDTSHIVKLLGVVSVSTPVYVIMEYMLNGDLKSYLRKERDKEKYKNAIVDGVHLMAAQIADGMAYLAAHKYVHRDLAARNCLVAHDRTVKIGDFGLTRDVLQSEYYRRNTEARLPVRWMAPEALSDNIYTTCSDVWSFGIVLWEIVTFSAYPYQGLSNDEVVKRVTAGHTLSRPANCPDLLFDIMLKCWRKNPNERPTFIEIIEILLLETNEKLSLDSFYKKSKIESNSITQSSPEESINMAGTESYPLLSWPSTRTNGLTNATTPDKSK